jgi:glutathione S-transferase
MAAKLWVVHNSHPCATVERALQLKGVGYALVELPPPLHAAVQRVVFGARTVPAIRFDDGEKVQGSRAILRRLEERVPDPPLYGGAGVDEAERWGDEVLQPLVRRVLWPALAAKPEGIVALQQGGRLPPLPAPVVRALAPGIARVEFRLNGVRPGSLERDLAALPGHLDRIDAWVADGFLGGERANAADLQIGASLWLLHVIEDLRPLLDGRPGMEMARRWFPRDPGTVPAGALPASAVAA